MESVALEKLERCPHCDSASIKYWCSGYDRLHEALQDSFEYSKCGDCGVVFESSRPVESEAYKAYPDYYGPHQSSNAAGGKLPLINRVLSGFSNRVLGQKSFQQRVKRVFSDLGPESVVLDYGCGAGKFLDQMSKRGCQTVGVDFSSQVIEQLKSKGHEAYSVDENIWSNLEDSSIDFIRMNHVVEHLYQPELVLANLLKKLKPGGKIHIAVPNPAGCTARMFRSMWHGLDCPRHVILYPPGTLSRYLLTLGYDSVVTMPEPLSKDHVRSWGYLIHRLGLLSHEKIDGLMYKGLLQLLAAVPCRLAAIINMADRYHMVARKSEL